MLQNLTEFSEFDKSDIFQQKNHAFVVNPRGFWCESEKCSSQGPEIGASRRQNDDCVVITFA